MFAGRLERASSELTALTTNLLRTLHLKKTLCRCTFDLLRDTVLMKCPGEYIPASFIIQAEWELPSESLTKLTALQKQEKIKSIVCDYSQIPIPAKNVPTKIVSLYK